MASEKMFNTYPLKEDISKNDVGMLWDTSMSQVKNFKMEKLAELMITAVKNNMLVPEVKDNETNEANTWSSKKIYTDLQSLLAKITELETKTHVASDEDAATYLGEN